MINVIFRYQRIWVKIGSETSWKSSTVHPLEMKIDSDLMFEKLLPKLCKEQKKNKSLVTARKMSRF